MAGRWGSLGGYPKRRPDCETLRETLPKIHKIIGGLLALLPVAPRGPCLPPPIDFITFFLPTGNLTEVIRRVIPIAPPHATPQGFPKR